MLTINEPDGFDGYSRTALIARVQVLEEMLKKAEATIIDKVAYETLPVFMERTPHGTYASWCESALALGKTYIGARNAD